MQAPVAHSDMNAHNKDLLTLKARLRVLYWKIKLLFINSECLSSLLKELWADILDLGTMELL